jgi:septal ring factor EnvC (AmiA/AmiB activator)
VRLIITILFLEYNYCNIFKTAYLGQKSNGATFAPYPKIAFMRNVITIAGLLVCLYTTPALAQDSSRLNNLEEKVERSERKESRAEKKLERQRKKLERKEKKLERRQNKTDRRERKRNREERKLERDQQRQDTTTPSGMAYVGYKKEWEAAVA